SRLRRMRSSWLLFHFACQRHWAALLGPGASRLGSLGVLCLHLPPELLVGNPFAFTKLLSGCLEDGLESRRVGHEQALDLIFILHAQKDGDGPTVARHDHRTVFALFQIRAEPRLHIRDRCDLHKPTSSPPIIRRLPSLIPMAKIWTSWFPASM